MKNGTPETLEEALKLIAEQNAILQENEKELSKVKQLIMYPSILD